MTPHTVIALGGALATLAIGSVVLAAPAEVDFSDAGVVKDAEDAPAVGFSPVAVPHDPLSDPHIQHDPEFGPSPTAAPLPTAGGLGLVGIGVLAARRRPRR